MRRAKIVATLGPALDDPDTLRAALESGIDVVRLNFSHGEHDEHAKRLATVRQLASSLGRNVAALADLQGPKIRLGLVPDPGITITEGDEVVLVPGVDELDEPEIAGRTALPVVYEALASDVEVGSLVLIDDGSLRLVVSRVDDGHVVARVVAGGLAKSRKGLNLPGVAVSAPALTPKDIADLEYAVGLGVDWVALSFVRRPEDVIDARARIHALGGECPLIAKLERPEVLDDLPAIVAASDAVMVARGDLGVEIGPERVPAIQKEIIRTANAATKPVITATEMLESMIASPRATRAEASDVANAVFDGTDALMLSGETAAGRYPVEAVRTMARIIEVAEDSPHLIHPTPSPQDGSEVAQVVARAAVQVARDVGAVALGIYSLSGHSIQVVSTFRPQVPLVGLTPSDAAARRTALMWGAEAAIVPMKFEAVTLVQAAERVLVDGGWARRGDRVVLITGPPGGAGGTSRILVHRVGEDFGK